MFVGTDALLAPLLSVYTQALLAWVLLGDIVREVRRYIDTISHRSDMYRKHPTNPGTVPSENTMQRTNTVATGGHKANKTIMPNNSSICP